MTSLRLEEPNLVHALRLARYYGDWGSVKNILYRLYRLMDIGGRMTEWERIISDIETDVMEKAGEPISGR